MPLETSGFDGLERDLEEILDGLSQESISRALQNGAAPVLARIVQNAPQGKTGSLKGALKAGNVKQKDGRWIIQIGAFKGEKVPHAFWVETGHGGPHPAPAHPYMRPAFDATVDEAYATIRKTLSDEMKG